jgi:Polysaccharide lyase
MKPQTRATRRPKYERPDLLLRGLARRHRVGSAPRLRTRIGRLARLFVLVSAALALLGQPASATTTSIPGGNLITNPSFDLSTVGWSGHNASVSSLSSSRAPVGRHVALVTRTSGTWYSLSVDRHARVTVPSDRMTHRYTARAWVKLARAARAPSDPPQLAQITVREWSGATLVGSGTDSVSMSKSVYRPVEVTYTPRRAGDQIDFYISRGRQPRSDGTVLQQGDAFLVGAATLVDAPAKNQSALWSTNLLTNPSFEAGTSGWAGYNASLARTSASDAPDGSSVAKVTWTGLGDPADYSITSDDSSGPTTMAVPFTESGARYTARAYVKGTPSTIGDRVQIGVREWSHGRMVNSAASAPLILAGISYQPIEVTYKAASPGDQLDLYIMRGWGPVLPGEYFLADAISLSRQAVSWAGDAELTPGPGWNGQDWTQSSAQGLACDAAPAALATTRIARDRFHNQGGYSYRFRVQNGDTCDGVRSELANPVGGYATHPRSDVAWDRQFYPGEDRWIAFQAYFPNDYLLRYPTGYNGKTSPGQDLLQFHQRRGTDDTPPVLVIDRGATLCLFTVRAPNGRGCGRSGGVPMGNPPHNRWVEITLHILFAADNSGYVKAYGDLQDGQRYRLLAQLVNQPTLKVNAGGWTPSALRIGIYRDSSPTTWGTEDLFIDGLTVGQDCAAVKTNAYGPQLHGQVDC